MHTQGLPGQHLPSVPPTPALRAHAGRKHTGASLPKEPRILLDSLLPTPSPARSRSISAPPCSFPALSLPHALPPCFLFGMSRALWERELKLTRQLDMPFDKAAVPTGGAALSAGARGPPSSPHIGSPVSRQVPSTPTNYFSIQGA